MKQILTSGSLKIAVVGAKGLFGEACMRCIAKPGIHEMISVTRADVDLTDLPAVDRYFSKLVFDVIIIAAAISGLEACLDDPDSALLVNAKAPEIIAKIANQKNAQCVYISTDYVFDGREDSRPSEASMPNPVNVYGETKLAGENLVLAAFPDALVARVSWLFGRGRASFVEQVLLSVIQGDPKTYISDKYSVPNFCDDLADALISLLDKKAKGIVHLVNDAAPESWFSYAEQLLVRAKSLGILNSYSQLLKASKLEQATFFRDVRPMHTAMLSKRLESEFGITIRSWEDGLVDFLAYWREHRLTNQDFLR